MPARKTGYAAARMAAEIETVETLWNGKETVNTARPGDWIVTNLNHRSFGVMTIRNHRAPPSAYELDFVAQKVDSRMGKCNSYLRIDHDALQSS
jgi:hypothetical protein